MLNFNLGNYRSGIARRLIIYVVLFSSFITLLTTAMQLYRDYDNDINLIEDQLQQAQDVHLKALTSTLWASDIKELTTHLEGISQLRDMQFLEVRDKDKIWVSVGTRQAKDVISREYPMIYSQRGRDLEIGTLTIVASLTGVYQRLIDKVWVILVSNGIKTFLVAGFILIIFHTLITRHLIRIADFARALDINKLDKSLGLDRKDYRKQKKDELDLVVNAINQMQVNIKESFTALEQSEERFQILAKVLPVGIFRTDAQGNCISTNERWRELAGMTEAEALGEGWGQALHPEDRERVFTEWYQAAADNIPFKTECRFQRPDGKITWLLALAEAELDAEGQVVGYVGTITDITERKLAEERFVKAFQSSPLPIIISRMKDGLLIDVNYGFELVTGYIHDEVVGKTSQEIGLWRNIADRQRVINILQKDGKVRNFEADFLIKDGEAKIFEISAEVIEHGGESCLITVADDITKRKQAEKKITEQVKRLKTLSELSMTLTGNPADVFKDVARMIGELLNVRVVCLSEVRGDELYFISVYVDGDVMSDAGSCPLNITPCATVEDTKDIRIYEKVAEKFPKAEFLKTHNAFSYCGFPSLDNKGEVVAVTCLLDDKPHEFTDEDQNLLRIFGQRIAVEIERQGHLNEQRQAEQELQKHRDHLEELVAERTIALETANKELESFSYSVSHDLRAPLRAIDGFSQAVLEDYTDKLDDVGKDYLQRVRTGAQRMGELIDDLLTLSRVTRSKLDRKAVNLSTLAQDITALLKDSQPERVVTFVIAPDMRVTSDKNLLRVVIENLLDNAWKFTSKQDQAHIEFGAKKKDGETIYFVRDNGVGFDMKYADKLFGAFQRLHKPEEFEGTGIGLATVQRIIHRHGGRVWAEGETGKGATFYITLP